MSTDAPAALQTAATDDSTDFETRDVRALTEYLTVLNDVGRVRGADEMYLVVSQSGSEYLVDARDGACTCPDAVHRDATCKHVRRVAFATGAQEIPDGVDADPQLGEHVTSCPAVATDGGTDEIVVAPDDGKILDDVDDDCACAGLPDGVPCAECYIHDGAEFGEDY